MCFSPTLLLEAALGNYPGVIQDFYRGLEQMIDCSSEKRQDLFYAKPHAFGNSGSNGGRAISCTFIVPTSFQVFYFCDSSVVDSVKKIRIRMVNNG